MGQNLMKLASVLKKKDREAIAFAVAQSRPDCRLAPTASELLYLDHNEVIDALLKADAKRLLPVAGLAARKLDRRQRQHSGDEYKAPQSVRSPGSVGAILAPAPSAPTALPP